jgi:hypothetical protein
MEIMKTSLVRSGAICAVGSTLLLTAPSILAADLTLHKVPPLTIEQAPAYPDNLARYHLGAQIEAGAKSQPIAKLELSSNGEDKNPAEAALLCDDPTVGYALPTGATTVLVSLPKIENISTVGFLNKGAQGSVSIAVSNSKLPSYSPQWKNTTETQLNSKIVRANVGPGEAKYVRLTFNVTQPGRIAGFGVYASPQVSDFTNPRARKISELDKSDSFALISYAYTDVHAQARALYVSSGSDLRQANNVIDDQPATAYAFAGEDQSPTAVIDLGQSRTLRRLSAVYSARPGRMEFYVLQSLPGPHSGDTAATLQMNESTLASLKSVGAAEDDGSQGRGAVDFPQTTGRYVMVRWIGAASADGPFSLAEVAAFGRGSGTLLAANTPAGMAVESTDDGTQTYDGKTTIDGKTMIDSKEAIGEGPQPPGEGPPPPLPPPPPFSFVPVLVPISE